MPTLLEVTKRAREILTPKKAWIKGAYAKDAEGDSTPVCFWYEGHDEINPKAICFCSLGAIRKAALDLGEDPDGYEYLRFEDHLADVGRDCFPADPRLEGTSAAILAFNDAAETTHEQVLGMFDCVIGKLEAGVVDAQ